jgi:DNA-binding CsgD family transcriptional regulator
VAAGSSKLEALGDREITERLLISDETARSHTKAMRRKLGASSRTQMVAKALQNESQSEIAHPIG